MCSNLLAIGFVTWAFFWAGLACVSIPIIIHILNRRRFKTVTWAAMDFLLRAMKKNRRRLRFEQWVLLATRCLLVFLLGLALARPLGCENQSVAGIGGRTGLNVFVIDNSYSMAYESSHPGGARTHLEQAKKIAHALIDRMNSGGESVAVITASRPAAALSGFEKPSYNLASAASAVDRVEQTYGATDILGALQLAMRVGQEEARQPVRNLYILSDSTRSAWEAPQQADALKQTAHDLAKLFRVTHYNLAEGRPQWNQAVVDVRPTAGLVTTKFGSDFAAVARGYGQVLETSLRWTQNDANLASGPSVRLDADTPPQIQTKAQFKSGGPQVVSAGVLTNDALDFDKSRWRVVDVASALRVLIVEGQRGVNVLEGSGAFLQVALSPPAPGAAAPGAAQTSSYVASELISDLELGNKVLGDYRAVVLAGVAQVSAPQADALAAFVKQGGTLLLFMGEPVDPNNYNQVLLPRKLMPGPLVKRMQAAADQKQFGFDFNPGGNLHPLLSLFKNQPNTGLDTAEVSTYWQVDIPPGSEVERVLDYGGGGEAGGGGAAAAATRHAADPAITVHALGDGRVVFVATTANAEWTNLPAKMVYVSLVHELLSGSVRTGDSWLNLTVGQPLEIPQTVRMTGTPTLLDPAKNPVVVEAITADGAPAASRPAGAGSGAVVYRSRPLNRPGVYTLSLGNATVPVAVNVPGDEADVRTLPAEAIKSALGGIEIAMRGAEVPAVAAAAEAGNDLSWAFMLAVFGLLAVECFMAMRFGHHRRTDLRPKPATA